MSLPAHTIARCSSPLSVLVFATFRCSDGRAQERAAAQLDYVVEPRLLHWYSLALSTTLSPTVTSWCVFHVDCAALVPHTGDERHSAFRLRAQPAVDTQLYQLASSGGRHTRFSHTDGTTALCASRNSPSRSFCSCVHQTPLPAHSFMKSPP